MSMQQYSSALYSMMTECAFGFILESEVEAEEGGWYAGRQEALSIQKSNRIQIFPLMSIQDPEPHEICMICEMLPLIFKDRKIFPLLLTKPLWHFCK